MREGSKLFLAYEPAHVPLLRGLVGQGGHYTVVAFDREVELDLDKAGIAYTSAASITTPPIDSREVVERTRALALWYKMPELGFFAYDEILLGEQYEVATLYYIQACVYWTSVVRQTLEHFQDHTSVTIPATALVVPDTADPTAKHKENLPVDCTRLVADTRGIAVEVIEAPQSQVLKSRARSMKRAVVAHIVHMVFFVLNACMSVLSGTRRVRMFATDPWSRIEPFVSGMDDIELVMSRRAQAREMLPYIWQTRARFYHRLDFANRAVRSAAASRAQDISTRWSSARESKVLQEQFVHERVSLWPVVRQVFDDIVARAADDIATIESIKRLFKRHRINVVLLFASTKGYNLVLARVAERLGIPSIENEHALVNDDKTLVHCRLNSTYLASYGPLINQTYESWGVEPWRLVAVGSPRFDEHAKPPKPEEVEALRNKLALSDDKPVLLYGMQFPYLSLEYGNFTSNEVWDIMQDVAAVQKELGLNIVLRPRPGEWRFNFYNREETLALFEDRSMAQFDSLKNLFAVSDVVLTGGSTVILEALLMHKPVVVYLPHTLDQDWRRFEEAGAVRIARTHEDLKKHLPALVDAGVRQAQVARADAFVQANFLNDGRAAKRMAALLRRVTMGTLRSERLYLEPLSEIHASEKYASWFNDKERTKHTRHGARTMTHADVKAYAAKVSKNPHEAVFAMHAQDGTHIGNISLLNIDYAQGSAEYAIMLGETEYGGKGIATEASRLLLRFGFVQLGLSRVLCGTSVANTPMQRLAERLGFKRSGTRQGVEFRPGEYHEVLDYVLEKEDFKS